MLSGKVFEYIAVGRPILAVVPPDGAAAELIRETGAGVVAPPDDPAAIRAALDELHARWRDGGAAGRRADAGVARPAVAADARRGDGRALPERDGSLAHGTGIRSGLVGPQANTTSEADAAGLYLDIVRRSLLDAIYVHPELIPVAPRGRLKQALVSLLGRRGYVLVTERTFDPARRAEGKGWPHHAHTMMGSARLENIRQCVVDVIRAGVPGDVIETGVWRGGGAIYMRAILRAYGVTDRDVWVADSFRGVPPPDVERYPADEGLDLHTYDVLAVSLDEVKRNFGRYDLLDDQVALPGGVVSRHAADRADREARRHAPRRRPLRVDHGRAVEPLPKALARWLRDHRRLRARSRHVALRSTTTDAATPSTTSCTRSTGMPSTGDGRRSTSPDARRRSPSYHPSVSYGGKPGMLVGRAPHGQAARRRLLRRRHARRARVALPQAFADANRAGSRERRARLGRPRARRRQLRAAGPGDRDRGARPDPRGRHVRGRRRERQEGWSDLATPDAIDTYMRYFLLPRRPTTRRAVDPLLRLRSRARTPDAEVGLGGRARGSRS